MLVALLAAAGCAPDKASKEELTQGYASLEAREYDQAISRANAVLQRTPSGPGSAEALYLKGQALEQKPAPAAEVNQNWQAARMAYVEALGRSPSRKLEALLHAGIANVAYFQEDYTTAEAEWTTAHDRLEDDTARAWVLYRIGLCRQRLGRFSEADQTFAAVQQRYPNTLPAQRAQEHAGARAFSVQLATFASSANADAALAALRKEGVIASKQVDSRGRSIILVGPIPSYQQAAALKQRYAGTYKDAVIVP